MVVKVIERPGTELVMSVTKYTRTRTEPHLVDPQRHEIVMSDVTSRVSNPLVREIVSYLDSPDLFSVGLLNRIFQAEADRLLYRSIVYHSRSAMTISCRPRRLSDISAPLYLT
jgi:hypothetical protein